MKSFCIIVASFFATLSAVDATHGGSIRKLSDEDTFLDVNMSFPAVASSEISAAASSENLCPCEGPSSKSSKKSKSSNTKSSEKSESSSSSNSNDNTLDQVGFLSDRDTRDTLAQFDYIFSHNVGGEAASDFVENVESMYLKSCQDPDGCVEPKVVFACMLAGTAATAACGAGPVGCITACIATTVGFGVCAPACLVGMTGACKVALAAMVPACALPI